MRNRILSQSKSQIDSTFQCKSRYGFKKGESTLKKGIGSHGHSDKPHRHMMRLCVSAWALPKQERASQPFKVGGLYYYYCTTVI